MTDTLDDRFEPGDSDVLVHTVVFTRQLRAAGVTVPFDAAIATAAALSTIGFEDRESVKTAMQATLVTCKEDIETFERLFEQFWNDRKREGRSKSADPARMVSHETKSAMKRPSGSEESDGSSGETTRYDRTVSQTDVDGDESVETAEYSPIGQSRAIEHIYQRQSHDALAASITELTRALATTPGRRCSRTDSGRFVDTRQALREALQTGGMVMSLPEARRNEDDVRGTILVDVSRSVLDSIDRDMLLEWLRLLVGRWNHCRVFFFDTDVREVTDSFDEESADAVQRALTDVEAAWGGGTRIGDAFATVGRDYPDAIDHRTVVFVISDGLECGDLDTLSTATARLAQCSRLFLWLNPLATSPSYEPTASGMSAVRFAIDGLFGFRAVEDALELACQLVYHDRTRLGYQYDRRLSTVE